MQPDRLGFPSLHEPRAEVLDALVSLCTTDSPAGLEKAAAVLGVGKTLTAEVERNARLASAPAARADRVYSGVLYEALDLASLEGAARRRATSWIAVASGLFGLVRPGDHIPALRSSRHTSKPLRPGSRTSRTIASYSVACAIQRASSPVAATSAL